MYAYRFKNKKTIRENGIISSQESLFYAFLDALFNFKLPSDTSKRLTLFPSYQ